MRDEEKEKALRKGLQNARAKSLLCVTLKVIKERAKDLENNRKKEIIFIKGEHRIKNKR